MHQTPKTIKKNSPAFDIQQNVKKQIEK